MEHSVTVKYQEKLLKASFKCPLCNEDWEFPFSAREILGKPQPSPEIIVALHFYGAGVCSPACQRFNAAQFIPRFDRISVESVTLTFEPIRMG